MTKTLSRDYNQIVKLVFITAALLFLGGFFISTQVARSQVDLTDNKLLLHLDANGFVDSSGLNGDAIPLGGLDCTGDPGIMNTGCTFDGIDDKIQLQFPAFDGSGDLTLSAWINPSAWGGGGFGRIMDNSQLFFFVGSNGRLYAVSDGSNQSYSADSALSLGSWQHAVIVRPADGNNVKFYVDGVDVSGADVDSGTPMATSSSMYIGGRGMDDIRNFEGGIDEVMVWGRLLTATEISDLYVEQSSGPADTTSPVITLVGSSTMSVALGGTFTDPGATAMDDVDGNITVDIVVGGDTVNVNATGTYVITYNVSDSSGNDAAQVTRTVNVGTSSGSSPVLLLHLDSNLLDSSGFGNDGIAMGDLDCSGDAGKLNNGCALDGVDDRIQVNPASFDGTGDLTMSAWINPIGWGENDRGRLMDNSQLAVYLDSSANRVNLNSHPGDQSYSSNNSIVLGSWQHVVVVRPADGDNVKFYVNGVDVSGSDVNSGVPVASTNLIIGGNLNSDRSFNGGIDEFTIWNKLLTSSEVLSLYNEQNSGGGEDNTPPVITLVGSSTMSVALGGTFTDPGATATDDVDGNITADIVVGGDTVNVNATGTYVITYNVSDSSGNAAVQKTRTVNVGAQTDNTPPVITLIGSSTINVQVNTVFTDPGATATDDVDGNITSNIVVGGTVTTSTLGTYTLTYNVSDSSGNAAVQKTRTVNVVDTTRPVITLIGSNLICLDVSSSTPYVDAGATAMDNYDGNITADIVVGGDTVNVNATGTYVITYNVTDSSGNQAVQVKRTVKVVDKSSGDTTKPVITLIGSSTITMEVDTVFTDPGATAMDSKDGDITDEIVVGGNIVSTSTLGTYVITYDVVDSDGNFAVQVTRTVHVVDTTAPVITLLGANPLVILKGGTYNDPGATAFDNYDGNISAEIVTGGATVNVNATGTYAVTYNVTDSSGNHAIQKTRNVNIVATSSGDITPPVITLIGASVINITVGSNFTDPGATATDDVDGNITSNIVVGGSVSTSTAGTYVLTYNVTDSSGNAAAQVTRVVNVSSATSSGGGSINIGNIGSIGTVNIGGGGGGGSSSGQSVFGFPYWLTPGTPGVTSVSGVTQTTPSGQTSGFVTYRFNQTLQPGSEGADVNELQMRLMAEGIYSGPITGYFGPLTAQAVRAYQARHGIPNIGIVGPLTQAQLNGSQTPQTTGQVAGTSTINVSAIQNQIASLQVQLLSLLEQLLEMLKKL